MSPSKEKATSPSRQDAIYFFLLNVSSAFMLSAAHNVLFFVLDLRTPVIHFLHHFFTFLFMALLYNIGSIPKTPLPLKAFALPVSVKVVETLLSSIVHSQNRTGGLYVIRIFDFLFTLTVAFLGRHYVPSKAEGKPYILHVIPLGLAVSLSWLEFGQLEYSSVSLFCAPLLAICRGISLLTLQRTHANMGQAHVEQFVLHYSGLVSLALALPALISYCSSHVEVQASWESIDFVLMGLSFLFMSCNLYSELWLSLSLNSRTVVAMEHTKYWGASIAQWIIQNMAHPSILAFAGKILAAASLFRIWSHS